MEKHQGAAVGQDGSHVTGHDAGHKARHVTGHDAGHNAGHDSGHDAGHVTGLISRQGRKKKASMAWLFKTTGNRCMIHYK